jgi:hypothetical protein
MIRLLVTDEHANGYEYNEKYFHGIDAWAQKNCPSYLGFGVQDVSDVSLQWDEIGYYEFQDEADAILFVLRWPGATPDH